MSVNVSQLGTIVAWSYVGVQATIWFATSVVSLQAIPKDRKKDLSFKKLFSLWIKTMWKMRSIYSAFAVHTFDFMTDVLVIADWWNADDTKDINSRLMAQVSIGILILYKFISSLAILFIMESYTRAFLQFCDLLLFEEILRSHKQIVKDIKSGKQGNNTGHIYTINSKNNKISTSIESTMRFKYIRSLEALFESTPQAVLQLVYTMRIGKFGNIIVIISIIQSIISMTNSMINNDSTYMKSDKFALYRKRFPKPSVEYILHALLRGSEISYRIFLFSLFWTVVSGFGFIILFLYELLLPLFFIIAKISKKTLSIDSVFLTLNQLVVLPPEWIFLIDDSFNNDILSVILYCCCCSICGWLIIPPYIKKDSIHLMSSIRIGTSFIEFIILLIFGIIDYYFNNDNSDNYLFNYKHCLIFLILSIIFFTIYTQYKYLMPDLSLPNNISLRSKWGYAFLGEVEEMQRLNDIHINDKNFWLEIHGIDNSYNNYDNELDDDDNNDNINKRLLYENTIRRKKKLEDIRYWLNDCFNKFKTKYPKLIERLFEIIVYDMKLNVNYLINNGNKQDMENVLNKLNNCKDSDSFEMDYNEITIELLMDALNKFQLNYLYYNTTDSECCAMYALANKQYKAIEWLKKNNGIRAIWINNKHFKQGDYRWARRLLLKTDDDTNGVYDWDGQIV